MRSLQALNTQGPLTIAYMVIDDFYYYKGGEGGWRCGLDLTFTKEVQGRRVGWAGTARWAGAKEFSGHLLAECPCMLLCHAVQASTQRRRGSAVRYMISTGE